MRPVFTLVFVLCFVLDGEPAASKKRARRSRAVEPQAVDVAAINNPQLRGSGLPALIRAQILLDRAHFSPGEIDGKGGPNFDRALTAFQQARGLPQTGQLDEPTWLALNADTAVPVSSYTLTEQDVAGPFVPVPSELMEQARLPALGYQSLEEKLGEQFHVSPDLLRRLNVGKSLVAGDELQVPNIFTAPTGKAARVVVSRVGAVTAMDASGKVMAHYPASSGSEHDPLPVGTWKIKGVARNPPFHYNPKLFWDADPSHSKTKIAPGPNNPVGVVWMDLSKDHYGLHGTPAPNKVGHEQSHGCIRLTNWDAMELASLVGPGVPAILTE